MKIKMLAAKIENEKFIGEPVEVETNKWIQVPPFATVQDVLIEAEDGRMFLSWVDSTTRQNKDGEWELGLCGGAGAKSVKRYMILPMPFDDPKGWVFNNGEDEPKKDYAYILCIECQNARTQALRYQLTVGGILPDRKVPEWQLPFGRVPDQDVIAWREPPRAKK